MKPISLPISFIRNVLLLSCLLVTSMVANAQFVISYPGTAQQSLTVCYGQSTLTVKVDVAVATSTGNTVKIQLPPGVNYVAGTVTKTAGTAALTIAESNITNLNAPVFAISPTALTGGDNITFTIVRTAGCAARTYALGGNTFKDVTTVTGSGGTKNFTPASGYNVDYPSLSLVQPAAITNAVLGTNYTRTFTVTNGASGVANHVYLYIDYPSAGIALQSLTVGSTTLTPISTVGDRRLFDITGAMLGSDNLLTNGEILTFTEVVKLKKCNATTSYGVGWGSSSAVADWCQTATGLGAVSMATGVSIVNLTTTEVKEVEVCTPGVSKVKISNNADPSLGNAAAMYNIVPIIAGLWGNNLFDGSQHTKYQNILMDGVSLTPGSYYQFGSGIYDKGTPFDLSTITTDPGNGLADLDGDGIYNDLPPGKSITIVMDRVYIPQSPNCFPISYANKGLATVKYYNACGDVFLPQVVALDTYRYIQMNGSAVISGQVRDNVPFTVRLQAGQDINPFKGNSNIRYWQITLPTGVTYVPGSAILSYGGTLTVSQTGQILEIAYPQNSSNAVNQHEIDLQLVYSCSAGANVSKLSFPITQGIHIDSSCNIDECYNNFIPTTEAVCPGPCAYISNTNYSIKRTTLGYTDESCTTFVDPSTLSVDELSTVLAGDHFTFIQNAKQNGSATNLHFYFGMDKPANYSNTHLLRFDGGNLHYKAAGSSTDIVVPLAAPADESSAAVEHYRFDLTSLLGTGGIPAALSQDDEVWIESNFRVNPSENTTDPYQLFGELMKVPTGILSYFYNNDGAGTALYCNSFVPDLKMQGVSVYNGQWGAPAISSCGTLNYVVETGYLLTETLNAFPGEFRPLTKNISAKLTMPDGFKFLAASHTYNYRNGSFDITRKNESPITATVNGNEVTFPAIDVHKSNVGSGNSYYFDELHFDVIPNCKGYLTPQAQIAITQTPGWSPDLASNSYTRAIAVNMEYNQASRPFIGVSDQTGEIQAIQPQHSWTVRMENNSNSTAPYTWLAIPTQSVANILKVVEVSSGTELTPITYSGGVWYKISDAGIASGTNKDYRIDFTYSNCNKSSISLIGGWNCTGYPTDPTQTTCGSNPILLTYNPQISEVELAADQLPPATVDLCTPLDYKYHITSAQAANTVANKVTIKCPAGLNPVAGSFYAEYPLGAGNWAVITPTQSGNDYTYDLTTHPAYPAQGLPGTLATSVTANRQMGIKFQLTTNCSFVANTNFTIAATANRPCGEPAIGNGLVIQGPSTGVTGVNPAYQTINVLTSTDMLNCSQEATITVKSTIIGGTTTSGDVLKVALPKGISMIPGSFTQIGGGAVTFISSSTSPVTGITEMLYQIPAGLTGGDFMEFSIKVIDGVTSVCGTNRIDVQTSAKFNNIACATEPSGYCSSIEAETGSGGVDFNVKKPDLTLTAVTICHNAFSGDYNVDFTVGNSGTAAMSSTGDPLVMKFYCNDAGNPTGTALATYSQAVDIAVAGTYSGTYSFTSATACANGVIAVISTDDNCICNTTQKAFTTTCNNPPVAINDINNTLINTPVSGNVLTNDSDPDGNNLTVTTTPISGPTHGTVVLNSDGSYIYTPTTGYTGQDTFTYEVCDDGTPKLCDQATVTIIVTDVDRTKNNPPVAVNDNYQGYVNTAVKGTVISNDWDPDGNLNPNSVTLVGSAPGNGTLTLNSDGTFTFIPNTDYTGIVTFQYQICDLGSPALCSTATATIDIEPKIGVTNTTVATDDSYIIKSGKTLTGNVLTNDYDPEGNTQTVNTTPVSNPAHGTVTLNADGTFTYTPTSGYVGPDNFIYTVCDNGAPQACDQATVYILVVVGNNPPVAINDINNTLINTPVSGNVLTNDSDPDGNNLTVTTTPISGPTHGTVVLNSDGSYIYTPTTGYTGQDTFTYEVCDDGTPKLCDQATVTITITDVDRTKNNPPVAVNDNYQGYVNTAVKGTVISNDWDPDGNLNPNSVTLVGSAPGNGTLTLNSDGTFTFIPNTGYTGIVTFQYQICDLGSPALCSTATVTIDIEPKIGVTNTTVATDDSYVIESGKTLTGNILTNDYDPEGNTQTVNTTPVSNPAHGTVTLNADGTFTYTPTSGYVGPDNFIYTVCDNGAPQACDQATVYITVIKKSGRSCVVTNKNVTKRLH